jgi:hypothetical protein
MHCTSLRVWFSVTFMVAGLSGSARAQTTLNFDSLNLSSAPFFTTGSSVTNYFAGFDISISHSTGNAIPVLADEHFWSSTSATPPYWVIPASAPNVLFFSADLTGGSYRLDFATSKRQVSFTRPELLADPAHNPSGVLFPEWAVTALDASGNTLGQAGEALTSYFTDVPAANFTLGPFSSPIASIAISGNSYFIASQRGTMLDNLILTDVPEPAALHVVAMGAALCCLTRRHRKSLEPLRCGLARVNCNRPSLAAMVGAR